MTTKSFQGNLQLQKGQYLLRVMPFPLFQNARRLGTQNPSPGIKDRQARVPEFLDRDRVLPDHILIQGLALLFTDIDHHPHIMVIEIPANRGIGLEELMQPVAPGAPVGSEHEQDRFVPAGRILKGGGDPGFHVGRRIVDRRLGFLGIRRQKKRPGKEQTAGHQQEDGRLAGYVVAPHERYLLKGPGQIVCKTMANVKIDNDGEIVYKKNMTEKIFHQDAYRTELEAIVRKKEFQDGCFRIYLDRTIFSPEGGGQPRDTGTINGIEVLDLAGEDDEIVHLLPEDPGEGPVRLRIDPVHRYDIMQQHTGQHLLSQVLEKLFGIRTLSFSMTGEHASIELDRAMLTAEEIDRTETECQRIIYESRPVRIFESDDPTSLKLRKPPKVEGRIRVVEISDYDQSACGGTHVRASGEIGMVKIIRTDRVRANVRIYFLAGFRCLRDYQLKHTLLSGIQQLVTLPLAEIPTGVRHLIDERDRCLRQIKNIQRQQIEEEILRHARLPDPLVIMESGDFAIPEIKHFAVGLTQKGKHVIAYTRAQPPYIVIGRGVGDFDLRSLAKEIFTMLAGKGGGRQNLIEGQPGDFARIDEVIRLVREKIGPPHP